LPDLTDLTVPLSTSIDFTSAVSKNLGSNRHTVNDLAAAKVGNTYTAADLADPDGTIPGDGYEPNTYKDYQFTCRDSFYDPEAYIINVYVQDVDGVDQDISTWDVAP
jgi:hypothetical protein